MIIDPLKPNWDWETVITDIPFLDEDFDDFDEDLFYEEEEEDEE